MARKTIAKSLLIFIPTLLGGSIIFTPAIAEPWQKYWVGMCLIAFVFALFHAVTKRRCGHGYITQGRGGFTYPFVIAKCPECGDRYNQ